MRNKNKITLDDGCNPELVVGAIFDGILGIPTIKSYDKFFIPSGITPFSKRKGNASPTEALGFFEHDFIFADVLRKPLKYINEFKQFGALIPVDCSLYRDAPLAVQIINLYRSRVIGSLYQRNGLYVYPLIRWGTELTYSTIYCREKIAFLGVEKYGGVCISTYGCISNREDKYYFQAGLEAMMEELCPKLVLVHGSMPHSIFKNCINHAKFVQYPDWITRKHTEV